MEQESRLYEKVTQARAQICERQINVWRFLSMCRATKELYSNVKLQLHWQTATLERPRPCDYCVSGF